MPLVLIIHEAEDYDDMIRSTINDPFEIVMMILMPLVVAVFLIWYSKRAISKGWIN